MLGRGFERRRSERFPPSRGQETMMVTYRVVKLAAWLLPLLWNVCCAYPEGAPEVACSGMMPQHGGAQVRQSPSPYTVSVSRSSYTFGSNITVVISGSTIEGYLVQARRTSLTMNTAQVIGSFIATASSKLVCVDRATGWTGVTHSREIETRSVSLVWIAPDASKGPQGNIQFRVTVVQDYSVFWQIISAEVTDISPATTTVAALAAASGSPPVTVLPAAYLGDCGVTKSCLLSPASCTSSALCSVMASWRPLDAYRVLFELQALGGAAYIAIGFSPTGAMAQSSIVACKLTSVGTVVAQQLYSSGYTSVTGIGPTNIANITGSSVGSRLTCGFVWNNAASVRTSSQAYDLQSSYYLVLAKGPVAADQVQQHSETPSISTGKIAIFGSQHTINGMAVTGALPGLTTTTPVIGGSSPVGASLKSTGAAPLFTGSVVALTQPTTSPGWSDPPRCGTTASCYVGPPGCSGSACSYRVTWTKMGPAFLRLELQATGANYISVGFGKSRSMVDVSIVACVRDSSTGAMSVQQLYSADYMTPGQTSSNCLLNASTSLVSGSISCSAIWNNDVALTSPGQLFDLRTSYYVIVARGNTAGSLVLKHSEAPLVSPATLTLLSSQITVNGEAPIGVQSVSSPASTVSRQASSVTVTAGSPVSASSSGSFLYPPGCTGATCAYKFAWAKSSEEMIINMDLQTCGGYSYGAAGFSKSGGMADTSIIVCTADSSTGYIRISIKQMYSSDHVTPAVISSGNIANLATSSVDGCSRCIFTWDNSLSARVKDTGLFDLSLPHFLVFAHGQMQGSALLKHSDALVVSSARYILLTSKSLEGDIAQSSTGKLSRHRSQNISSGYCRFDGLGTSWLLLIALFFCCRTFYRTA